VLGGFGVGFGPGVPTVGPDTDHFRLTVTVRNKTGHGAATSQAVATVTPPPAAVQATGTLINAVVGQQFSGTVATFTAQDTSAQPGDFTATIDWGDGSTSTGTVVADPNGGFDVTGTHTYSLVDGFWLNHDQHIPIPAGGPGREAFIITVTIHDQADNSTATA